jgi:hypothetical protein
MLGAAEGVAGAGAILYLCMIASLDRINKNGQFYILDSNQHPLTQLNLRDSR